MTKTIETASFGALTPAHLKGFVTLCSADGWPHRPEDWGLTLVLSCGIPARGLAPGGDGIAMGRGDAPAAVSQFQSFTLAAQALS
jgi:hypothetical protein